MIIAEPQQEVDHALADCPEGPYGCSGCCDWLSFEEPPADWDEYCGGLPVDPGVRFEDDLDRARTPKLLLALARRERSRQDAAARHQLELAVAWAHSHPVVDKDGMEKPWRVSPAGTAGADELAEAIARIEARVEAKQLTSEQAEQQVADLHDWHGIPAVAWSAPAAFAAAVGLTTYAGKLLIRDALIVCHRTPELWKVFLTTAAGTVPVARIRQVARLLVGQPADVCKTVDRELAPIIHAAGPVKVEDTITEITTRLDQQAVDVLDDAAESHHVTLDDTDAAGTGTASLEAKGDFLDYRALNNTIGVVAEILKKLGSNDTLGVRRAKALALLAHPHQAAALLDWASGITTHDGQNGPAPDPAPTAPAKDLTLYVHIPFGVLVGLYTMGRVEALGPVLAELVRRWCGRDDVNLTVRPVIDLNQHGSSSGYQPSETLREQVILTNPTCVFPYCSRRARSCDQDHIEPYDHDGEGGEGGEGGGPTCSCNLAPGCRHHHNLKTHAGWSYTRLDETTFLWTDTHGLTYLRTAHGTQILGYP